MTFSNLNQILTSNIILKVKTLKTIELDILKFASDSSYKS